MEGRELVQILLSSALRLRVLVGSCEDNCPVFHWKSCEDSQSVQLLESCADNQLLSQTKRAPGITWGSLLHVSAPACTVSCRAGDQICAIRVSTPRSAGSPPQVGLTPNQGQYPMALTALQIVSRHPSQFPEAHRPSVPRVRLVGPSRVGPSRRSSRA